MTEVITPPRHTHQGITCTGCPLHPSCSRPAKYPPNLCERCWRWTRYHQEDDGYRKQVRERQSRYWQRKVRVKVKGEVKE